MPLNPLSVLPSELQSLILTQLDTKTLLRSRRVSRRWNDHINGCQDVWRTVALRWHLIPHLRSPLPSARSMHETRTAPLYSLNVHWSEGTQSTTGYFNNLASFRDLCERYARLTLAWESPPNLTGTSPAHLTSSFGYVPDADYVPERLYLRPASGMFALCSDGKYLQMFQRRATKEFAFQDDLSLHSTLTEYGKRNLKHLRMDPGLVIACHPDEGILVYKDLWPTHQEKCMLPLPEDCEPSHVYDIRLRYPSCLVLTCDDEEYQVHLFDVPSNTLCTTITVLAYCLDVTVDDKRTMIIAAHRPPGLVVFSAVNGKVLLNMMPDLFGPDHSDDDPSMPGKGPIFRPQNIHVSLSSNKSCSCSVVGEASTTASEWKTIELLCAGEGSYAKIGVQIYINCYVYYDLLLSMRGVFLDSHTDTLVLHCFGHAMVIRPCSMLVNRDWQKTVHLGIIPLQTRTFGEPQASDDCYTGIPVQSGMKHLAAGADGRLCLVFEKSKYRGSNTRVWYEESGEFDNIFLIDLRVHRLSGEHPIHPLGNIGSRLLGQMPEKRKEFCDLQMDAIGVYLCRSGEGLLGFDLGLHLAAADKDRQAAQNADNGKGVENALNNSDKH
ncbi:hypothetical protein IE81DRAFT_332207 [Ceraceosorus guamensis]|uniref:F-box domain-containing protein n=1 Tax=Ceraceosorus guamensis TaxID=1522189 RepID=A0A316VQM1_9BASI|nr:hypothetical protein IE81DRAFT_332207 [Ceraceosorus guamensis]PWN39630.1 hypothetical protein IE81DRAFT_332207 [Ceraceosorus guamensis]